MAKYQINYEAIDSDENKVKGVPYKDFIELSETIMIILLAAAVALGFVFRTVAMGDDSMAPTIQSADKIVINSYNYTPAVGDVVAVDNYLLGDSKLRRIVAKGGDKVVVNYETGKLSVNGTEIEEAYLSEYITPEILGSDYSVTVPEGQYFVLCDNRNSTSDSRKESIGCISADQIKGKAAFRILPVNKIGAVDPAEE